MFSSNLISLLLYVVVSACTMSFCLTQQFWNSVLLLSLIITVGCNSILVWARMASSYRSVLPAKSKIAGLHRWSVILHQKQIQSLSNFFPKSQSPFSDHKIIFVHSLFCNLRCPGCQAVIGGWEESLLPLVEGGEGACVGELERVWEEIPPGVQSWHLMYNVIMLSVS